MPTIRIDKEVYNWLQSQARAFEDTPNSVLRRIAALDSSKDGARSSAPRAVRGSKTPQSEFRAPLLALLAESGGQLPRVKALKGLERRLAPRLTETDKSEIKSGGLRWEKSAEWEVRAMRMEGLLKPVHEAPSGYWALTEKGGAAAKAV